MFEKRKGYRLADGKIAWICKNCHQANFVTADVPAQFCEYCKRMYVVSKPRQKKGLKLYKVLNADMTSCNGGDSSWVPGFGMAD